MYLLCSDCRSLAELESVLSAICGVIDCLDDSQRRNDATIDEISRRLVQPLLTCLCNETIEIQMAALVALRSLSASYVLTDRFRATIMSHLMPYLSTDADVDCVVYARTAMHWIDFYDNG
jgi:hypothetical protein